MFIHWNKHDSLKIYINSMDFVTRNVYSVKLDVLLIVQTSSSLTNNYNDTIHNCYYHKHAMQLIDGY